ncbi:hypothetical protein QFC22_006673 [Naganishia vaughanmartiniae]|uniref:Uncharacterized protein n=2 Tax=Naganishia TaxID=1851509 RepID=A0ACC2UZD4_9TREE|nr:hypothetical protein QFC21_006964 [Naganishia friedmannii]KAJ9110817.1 hypothetical protein QFC22_006673 [Naganishia vaughanmartiniae]
MPRQSRSSRPAARPSAPSGPSHQQSRSASTAAYPSHAAPPAAHAPQPAAMQGQKQPGLLAQAASTAMGVGAGSVIGHGISSMLFGGGSRSAEAPPAPAESAPVNQQQQWASNAAEQAPQCTIEAKDFTKCLDATGDFQSCSYYLEALKACQAAAARY